MIIEKENNIKREIKINKIMKKVNKENNMKKNHIINRDKIMKKKIKEIKNIKEMIKEFKKKHIIKIIKEEVTSKNHNM